MPKHTPGPWNIAAGAYVETEDGKTIADVWEDEDTGKVMEETQANARLIAAAPDLLEARKLALTMAALSENSESSIYQIVEAAVIKATGDESWRRA